MHIQELGLTWGIFKVPVIAVFTKYDQFRLDLGMTLEDEDRHSALAGAEMERILSEHYLASLSGSPPFVCLESEARVNRNSIHYTDPCLAGMHRPGQPCTDLIEITAKCVNTLRVGDGILSGPRPPEQEGEIRTKSDRLRAQNLKPSTSGKSAGHLTFNAHT